MLFFTDYLSLLCYIILGSLFTDSVRPFPIVSSFYRFNDNYFKFPFDLEISILFNIVLLMIVPLLVTWLFELTELLSYLFFALDTFSMSSIIFSSQVFSSEKCDVK